MKKANDDLTLAEVQALFTYDPVTGSLRTRQDTHKGRWPAGRLIGGLNGQGYLVVCIGPDDAKRTYRVHRLAWLLTYGVWPEHEVDHINGIRNDNRIENLREATASQNLSNKGPIRDGLKGAYRSMTPGRWRSVLGRGPGSHLGCFDTEEEAHEAYKQAAAKRFGEFARFD